MNQPYFSNIREQIISRLDLAEASIDIAMAWFTNPIIYDLLLSRAANGIKIKLLISDSEANFRTGSSLDFTALTRKKMDVRIFRTTIGKFMHHKFCIIDNKEVITGSYNFSNNAQTNFENIVILQDLEYAKHYGLHFKTIFQHRMTISLADFLITCPTSTEQANQFEDITLFNLTREFEAEIKELSRKAAELKIGLNMELVENMIRHYGTVGAAARLSDNDPQPGFLKLIVVKRFDLTFEYATAKAKYAILFSKQTIENAKAKLRPYLRDKVDQL